MFIGMHVTFSIVKTFCAIFGKVMIRKICKLFYFVEFIRYNRIGIEVPYKIGRDDISWMVLQKIF